MDSTFASALKQDIRNGIDDVLAHCFDIDFNTELENTVNACKNNGEVRQLGIEWAIEKCKNMKASGLPCLHFCTMGNSDNIYMIASELF